MFEKIEGIEFSVSSLCNLNCSYCFFPEYGKRNELVNHSFKDLEQMLEKIPLGEFLWINLAGGELSMLNSEIPDGIKQIRKLEKKQDISIDFKLTTNGTSLEKILEWIDRGLINANGTKMSWDGLHSATTSRGSLNPNYDDEFFKKKIRLLGESKWNDKIIVRYAVTPDTIDNLYDSVLYLLKAGCRKFEYYFLFNSESYETEAFQDKFREQLLLIGEEYLRRQPYKDKRFMYLNWENQMFAENVLKPKGLTQRISGCSVMGKVLYVDFDGKLYPCSKFMDDVEIKHDYVIGSLTDGIDYEAVKRFEEKINSVINKPIDCPNLHCFDCSGDNIKRITSAIAPYCDSCALRSIETKAYLQLNKNELTAEERSIIKYKSQPENMADLPFIKEAL